MHVLNQAVRQDGLTSSEAATEHDVEVTADTALDLQSKVFEIPVAVSQALQDLDLVVRPLKPVGTDAVLPRLAGFPVFGGSASVRTFWPSQSRISFRSL